jgi:hypothetical protein
LGFGDVVDTRFRCKSIRIADMADGDQTSRKGNDEPESENKYGYSLVGELLLLILGKEQDIS